MYNIKTLNISNLINDTSHYVNKMLSIEDDWLTEVSIENPADITECYLDICEQNQEDNKWILMINPDLWSLDTLQKSNDFDCGKILRVSNVDNKKLSIEHIKNTLLKGNCSAVVLSNTAFNADQISQLTKSAQRGRTQCFLINNYPIH